MQIQKEKRGLMWQGTENLFQEKNQLSPCLDAVARGHI